MSIAEVFSETSLGVVRAEDVVVSLLSDVDGVSL